MQLTENSSQFVVQTGKIKNKYQKTPLSDTLTLNLIETDIVNNKA